MSPVNYNHLWFACRRIQFTIPTQNLHLTVCHTPNPFPGHRQHTYLVTNMPTTCQRPTLINHYPISTNHKPTPTTIIRHPPAITRHLPPTVYLPLSHHRLSPRLPTNTSSITFCHLRPTTHPVTPLAAVSCHRLSHDTSHSATRCLGLAPPPTCQPTAVQSAEVRFMAAACSLMVSGDRRDRAAWIR